MLFIISKIKKLSRLFLCALLFYSSNVFAQQAKIDSFIVKQMKEQAIPGLSIGIVKNGKILLTKGYGLANIELNVRASGKTVYKIASISKQFIAVAIMQLVQQNKLSLNDSLPRFFTHAPDSWRSITIKHLLHHTSGLPAEPPGFDALKDVADSVYINRSFQDTLAYPTGSKFEYSNFGYFVLADIIRIVSQMPFETYMKKYVFDELQMKATRTTSANAIIPNRAGGYIKDERNNIQNALPALAMRPSGAIISSVNDMVQYELGMQHQKLLTGQNWNLVFNDTLKTPMSMDDEPMYYAYGWMNNKQSGKQLLHHGGSLPGFKSVYFRLPQQKTAIIVLTNSDYADCYAIAFGIEDILRK